VTRLYDDAEKVRRILGGEDMDHIESDLAEGSHIIPHGLAEAGKKMETSCVFKSPKRGTYKMNFWRLFEVVAPEELRRLDGTKIDHPSNGALLIQGPHRCFGGMKMYFEATGASLYSRFFHTHQIELAVCSMIADKAVSFGQTDAGAEGNFYCL
jgi:hypothetical protein